MHLATMTETYPCTSAPIGNTSFPLPWFAVRVREKFRSIAEQRLGAQSIELFSPVTHERRQWSDRTKLVTVPLFAGYLFCRFDPENQLAILRTMGVIDIVRSGGQFSEVDPTELEAIDLALRSNLPLEALPELIQGQSVRVVRGPMSGVTGVLVEQKSRWRLVLGVTMMNRSVSVEIDRTQVEAID